jgi:hypothetical protein
MITLRPSTSIASFMVVLKLRCVSIVVWQWLASFKYYTFIIFRSYVGILVTDSFAGKVVSLVKDNRHSLVRDYPVWNCVRQSPPARVLFTLAKWNGKHGLTRYICEAYICHSEISDFLTRLNDIAKRPSQYYKAQNSGNFHASAHPFSVCMNFSIASVK